MGVRLWVWHLPAPKWCLTWSPESRIPGHQAWELEPLGGWHKSIFSDLGLPRLAFVHPLLLLLTPPKCQIPTSPPKTCFLGDKISFNSNLVIETVLRSKVVQLVYGASAHKVVCAWLGFPLSIPMTSPSVAACCKMWHSSRMVTVGFYYSVKSRRF